MTATLGITRDPRARPCPRCGTPTRSREGRCGNCRQAQHPERPCLHCRILTRAADRICRTCTQRMAGGYRETDALTNGTWTTDRHGIQRWTPDTSSNTEQEESEAA